MAEYANILFIRLLTATLLSGEIPIFQDIQLVIKTIALATLFV
jgi:hypothetical protein